MADTKAQAKKLQEELQGLRKQSFDVRANLPRPRLAN